MLLALVLAAAAPQTALDAERSFAADAQKIGQWAAFRKWATDDATMFVPQPVKAQEWLKDRKEPAKAIEWWPTASYVSCDGTLAVNVGGWQRSDGSVGSFSTVWTRQRNGGWRWLMDKGDNLKTAPEHPAKPRTVRSSCVGKAVIDVGGLVGFTWYYSKDQSLFAAWGDDGGADSFFTSRWNGRHYHDVIEAPAAK